MSNVENAPQSGIYHRSVHGGKWIFIDSICQKILSLFTFLILARLLNPSDYGVIAVVFLITGFFDTVTSHGLDKAVMQKQDDPVEYLDVLWTLNFLKSAVVALIILFFSPSIAHYFHIEAYVNIMRWGSLFVLIPSLSNSRQFYFFRNLDFKKIFIRDMAGQISYIIFAFGWAIFVQRSVWALLVGQLAKYVISSGATYVLQPYRQRFSFGFGKLKKFIGFGKWAAGQNFLDYLLGMLDSLYIGRLLDSSSLGIYTKARDLANMPVSPFFSIIDRIGFVAYAQLQDKLHKIQEGFLKTFDMITAITVPVFLILASEGGLLVQVVLGQKWLGIVLPLKILAATSLFSSLVVIVKPIFDAIGKPEINFKANVLQLIFFAIFIYLGVKWGGLIGVAFATLLAWALILFYVIIKVRPILKLGWDKFEGTVMAVGGASLVVLGLVLAIRYWQNTFLPAPLLVFFVLVGVGVIYCALVWYIGGFYPRGPRQTLVSIIREIFKKFAQKHLADG